MPPKGSKQTSSAPAITSQGPRRYLRAHSRLSAAADIREFFASSPIPKFRHQLLEAYVRAIAQEYESEPEPVRDRTPISLSKTDSSDDIDESVLPETYSPRKVYLTSGLFCEVQHRKKNVVKPFTFPLPVKSSTILLDQQDFVLPFSVYNTLPQGQSNWKNLKKSMYIIELKIFMLIFYSSFFVFYFFFSIL